MLLMPLTPPTRPRPGIPLKLPRPLMPFRPINPEGGDESVSFAVVSVVASVVSSVTANSTYKKIQRNFINFNFFTKLLFILHYKSQNIV